MKLFNPPRNRDLRWRDNPISSRSLAISAAFGVTGRTLMQVINALLAKIFGRK